MKVSLTYANTDVEIHHLEKFNRLEFSNVKIVAKGPLRAAVSATVKFGKSKADVTVSLIIREFEYASSNASSIPEDFTRCYIRSVIML